LQGNIRNTVWLFAKLAFSRIDPGVTPPGVSRRGFRRWKVGRVDIPIVPFDESACTRPSKLPATREIALLLDAYDIHPTYIHRGRKTERGCRVEHFVEASNSRACKRAQEARSAREVGID
jgi:hypothetical protein